MVLELVILWAIVIGTVTWFIRDERRRRADADMERAARYYAHAPRYRHAPATPKTTSSPVAAASPAPRTGGLGDAQRRFIKAYAALN